MNEYILDLRKNEWTYFCNIMMMELYNANQILSVFFLLLIEVEHLYISIFQIFKINICWEFWSAFMMMPFVFIKIATFYTFHWIFESFDSLLLSVCVFICLVMESHLNSNPLPVDFSKCKYLTFIFVFYQRLHAIHPYSKCKSNIIS